MSTMFRLTGQQTYRAAYEEGARFLLAHGVPEAEISARRLLEHVCCTAYSDLFTHGDRCLLQKEQRSYEELIQKRSERIPVAYLTQTVDFMGLAWKVTPDVLIPRPDTEILVERALTHLEAGMQLLDLCTGSGCVELSLLSHSKQTKAVLTDISEKARMVAQENAKALQLTSRAVVMQADLYPPPTKEFYDMIVSNPPYIATEEIMKLEPEVSQREPRIALDGGTDGLVFYRRILQKAPRYLKAGGYLLLEIGYDQGMQVMALLEQTGFTEISLHKDFGGMDRVVEACLKK